MAYYARIIEDNPFIRMKAKAAAKKILVETGFTQKTRMHIPTKTFTLDDITAELTSGIERNLGSQEHNIKPFNYGYVQVIVDGNYENHSKFASLEQQLSSWFDLYDQ